MDAYAELTRRFARIDAVNNAAGILGWDASVTSGGPDVGKVTYTVTLDDQPVCRDIETLTCDLTGLVEGQDYTVKVKAINEVFGGDDFSTSSLIVNTNPIQVGTP